MNILIIILFVLFKALIFNLMVVVLSHSPMKELPLADSSLRDGLVLVVGRDEVKEAALRLAEICFRSFADL
jgi:hypothetical protein